MPPLHGLDSVTLGLDAAGVCGAGVVGGLGPSTALATASSTTTATAACTSASATSSRVGATLAKESGERGADLFVGVGEAGDSGLT